MVGVKLVRLGLEPQSLWCVEPQLCSLSKNAKKLSSQARRVFVSLSRVAESIPALNKTVSTVGDIVL